jgi:ParB family chromosome partitioning protein
MATHNKTTLGKNFANLGLKELLSDIAKTEATTPTTATQKSALRKLPIEILQPGKFQPRHDIDPETLEELADSIRTQGIIQPVVVRSIAKGDHSESYEIIAGERRWRAAQLAGLMEIPAIVREISDEQAIAMSLIENIQRENLNAIDTALGLKRLIEEFQMTHQSIAETVGKSRATVSNFLRLLELHDEVKVMVQHGDLEMGHARALLALDQLKQIKAAKIIRDKDLSVRATEKLVHVLQNTTSSENLVKIKDPNISTLERKIKDKLSAKVSISHNDKGNGKITIHYNSLDELEGILDKF